MWSGCVAYVPKASLKKLAPMFKVVIQKRLRTGEIFPWVAVWLMSAPEFGRISWKNFRIRC